MAPLNESTISEAYINDNFKLFEGRCVEGTGDSCAGETASFDAFEDSFQTTFPSLFTTGMILQTHFLRGPSPLENK